MPGVDRAPPGEAGLKPIPTRVVTHTTESRALATAVDRPAAAPLSAPASIALERLRGVLETLRRRTRYWIWVESLALLGLAVAALFWGTLLLDWLVEPPQGVRVALLWGGVLGLAVLVGIKLVSRLQAKLEDTSLATLLERRYPAFRDSLSTAIELSSRPGGDVDGTLLETTIQEAAAVVGGVEPDALFRRRSLVMLALAGALAVASVVGLALARPAVADLWMRRMVLAQNEPWPRRTSLEAVGFTDGVRKVARGSDVDVIVTAAAAGEIPEIVDLRFRGAGGWRTDRMGMRGGVADGTQAFGHLLKGVSEDLTLEVRGGDARLRGLLLKVVDAPSLERVELTATLPAYLGGGVRTLAPSRLVQVPRGSTVEIVCHATKPLAAATLLAIADGREETLATLPTTPAPATARQIAARLERVEGERGLVLRLTDTDGLENREPIGFVLTAVPDEAPQVAVKMQGISTAVTPQARIPLEGAISDDHGLAAAAVRISVANGDETLLPIGRIATGAMVVELPADAPEVVRLEPLALAPGRTLGLVVSATDGCALDQLPNTSSSDTWTLQVVTSEALLAMLEAREVLLRRRFESVIEDLQQARNGLAGEGVPAPENDAGVPPEGAGPVVAAQAGKVGEAAARATGETGEIAEAFRLIRTELDNNQLLSPELQTRVVTQIAEPLGSIASAGLPALLAASRRVGPLDREGLLRQTDEVLARMRAVLDRMMELESFNEVIELLRGVIRTQEEIRADTLKRQKQRAREALQQP